eukprot:scaffold25_cov342-Pavlova_lutheri.AAC.40
MQAISTVKTDTALAEPSAHCRLARRTGSSDCGRALLAVSMNKFHSSGKVVLLGNERLDFALQGGWNVFKGDTGVVQGRRQAVYD